MFGSTCFEPLTVLISCHVASQWAAAGCGTLQFSREGRIQSDREDREALSVFVRREPHRNAALLQPSPLKGPEVCSSATLNTVTAFRIIKEISFFNKVLHENASGEDTRRFPRRLTVRSAVAVEIAPCRGLCSLREIPPHRLESGIKFRIH